jgi:hypothetical protein
MPTVLRFGANRVVIYFNDHLPAHVHVLGSGNEAVFALNCPGGPVLARENYGFALRELTRIATVLLQSVGLLCRAWREIHGIG